MSLVRPAAPNISEEPEGGIVFAFRFDGAGHATSMLHGNLHLERTPPGFLWVHLNLADVRARHFVETLKDLPEPARDLLLGAHDPIGFDHEEGAVWGTIPDFVTDMQSRTQDIAHLRIALGPGYAITGRRRALQSTGRVRGMIARGKTMAEPADLFETLIERIAQSLNEIVSELAQTTDVVEENIVDSDSDDDRKNLVPLRRAVVRLDRMVANIHNALRRFEHQRAHELPQSLRDSAHRLAQRFETLRQEVHGLNDRARLLHDEMTGKVASQTNDNLYVLSVLTAVIMPATLVTGFFGMNTNNLFFKDYEAGTWLAALACLAASGLTYVILRRRGILP